MDVKQLAVGLLLGSLIGYLAYRAGSLSRSGGWAAAATGGLIFGLGGLPWAILLLTFFVSSSGLSRMFSKHKAALNEKFAKGSQRDWSQVLANGGLGALLAVAYALSPEAGWIWPAYLGAMAAVNADTWATELGVLNPGAPRLITNGKVVERGTSGAISPGGSLAALAGGLLVGLAAGLLKPGALGMTLAAAGVGGLAGSFFDSWLGATVQAIYTCPSCNKETERHPRHTCGTATQPRRGWFWVNNEVVNFACAAAGALAAMAVWRLL